MRGIGPRILLVGGTYRALCVLERLLERGERVAAFLGQEREGERDFCSEILEVCDRASVPARSGRKLGEETVRWLEDRIRPELAIAVGLSSAVPLVVGGNCRLGLVEIVDSFQSESCPGVILRQRGQNIITREIPMPTDEEDRGDAYLQIVDEMLLALDEYLDRIEASYASVEVETPFEPRAMSYEDFGRISSMAEPGCETESLEGEVAQFLEADHVVAVRSAEEAFTAVLGALGVGEGHEVLVPGIASGAVFEAVRRSGARAVLVDVEPDRLTLDPRCVPEAVTPDTKAMIVSHAFGQPAALDHLYSLAEEFGLELVEDAGESLGARLGPARLGRTPCTAVFRLPVREVGGEPRITLVTLSSALASRAHKAFEGLRVGDGLAALARRTVERCDDVIAVRREIAFEYASSLAPYDAFQIPPTPEDALPVYPAFVVRMMRFARTSAEDLYKLLGESGIETRRIAVPASERDLAQLPVTEEARSNGLLLPVRAGLTKEECEHILDSIFDYAIG
jgi:dTDP-4-amino-4,6-dideoxygalactose transaminase